MTTLSHANNPLLQLGSLPLFDQIKPEHVSTAIDVLLTAASEALETVLKPAPINTNSDAPRNVLASFAFLLVLILYPASFCENTVRGDSNICSKEN